MSTYNLLNFPAQPNILLFLSDKKEIQWRYELLSINSNCQRSRQEYRRMTQCFKDSPVNAVNTLLLELHGNVQ